MSQGFLVQKTIVKKHFLQKNAILPLYDLYTLTCLSEANFDVTLAKEKQKSYRVFFT